MGKPKVNAPNVPRPSNVNASNIDMNMKTTSNNGMGNPQIDVDGVEIPDLNTHALKELKDLDTNTNSLKDRARDFAWEHKGKMAAVGVVGAATLGNYINLSSKKKQCITNCFPLNWEAYVNGNGENDFENYPWLFPGDEDLDEEELKNVNKNKKRCSKDNLKSNNYVVSDKSSCTLYCKNVCDVNFNKALEASFKGGGKLAGSTTAAAVKGAADAGGDIAKDTLWAMFSGFAESLGIDPKLAGGIIGLLLALYIYKSFT